MTNDYVKCEERRGQLEELLLHSAILVITYYIFSLFYYFL